MRESSSDQAWHVRHRRHTERWAFRAFDVHRLLWNENVSVGFTLWPFSFRERDTIVVSSNGKCLRGEMLSCAQHLFVHRMERPPFHFGRSPTEAWCDVIEQGPRFVKSFAHAHRFIAVARLASSSRIEELASESPL